MTGGMTLQVSGSPEQIAGEVNKALAGRAHDDNAA
jgi:hypothetical protein